MNWINYKQIFKVSHEREIKLVKLVGFTYQITNLTNGMIYYGKKHFFNKRKGKVFESDWKSYTSSSKYVNADIAKLGIDKFSFIILDLYTNKAKLSKAENDLILHSGSVLSSAHYNRNWRGIRAPVLKELKEFFQS